MAHNLPDLKARKVAADTRGVAFYSRRAQLRAIPRNWISSPTVSDHGAMCVCRNILIQRHYVIEACGFLDDNRVQ